ncbi:RNA polymerase factor sigma-54 [Candidatus Cetobacterium colombiensis]|uniref:RNA polymerase factor sigma-54 n=1 Tax=Candidatus Cetobacterium colombiensis TaxID=3073100 RepID=A0ABU4WB59_9FUSO|nr:RNA polymerase factor sigma-54 [Candidatus Cetobacterium colombiensis]MDX8336778.1 RNA polymerase factor sigma-54 [Candidatus Cetobacterium colombiensis]
MDFKLGLNQNLKLSLTLEMKLSIDILKMNLKELKDYLENESIENPNIEVIYPKLIDSKNTVSENYLENIGQVSESLVSYLIEQVSYLKIKKEVKLVLEYLINNLDERGYLEYDILTLKSSSGFKSIIFKEALNILHTLEPFGVGATDLIDCLKIQLKNKGIFNSILIDILEKNLNEIADKNFEKIALERVISLEEVKRYIEIIKSLNPKPARGFYVNKNTKYIIPDLIIKRDKNNIIIDLNEGEIPKIRLKTEVVSFKDKNKVLMLERAIGKRQQTLLKVGKYILNYQKDFILMNKTLKTLKIKDVAFELGLHESTVSRAIKDKFIKIDNRIETLKKYIVLDNKSEKIKKEILEIIENEDRKNPLSDNKILEMLLKKNFLIKRRTVAKYREELGIASIRKRKK